MKASPRRSSSVAAASLITVDDKDGNYVACGSKAKASRGLWMGLLG